MRRFIASLYGFLTQNDRYVRAPEYLLSIATVAWGILVMRLPSVMFTRSTTFRYLAESPLPALIWGGVMVALGMTTFVAVWTRHRRLRLWTSAIGAILWSAISFSFYVAQPAGPGWAVYLIVFVGFNAFTYLRLVQRGGM